VLWGKLKDYLGGLAASTGVDQKKLKQHEGFEDREKEGIGKKKRGRQTKKRRRKIWWGTPGDDLIPNTKTKAGSRGTALFKAEGT